MGRSPCCEKVGLKKGPWTPEEDQKLLAYIEEHGHGSWRALPAKAGLQRCGKSCRLRWTNYLRPDIKRGKFSLQEEQTIIQLHALLGNRWSAIATHLPKRTDNEIKNYWNTHLKKRLTKMGIDPVTHKPQRDSLGSSGQSKDAANLSHMAQWESARLEAEARLVRESKPLTTNPYQSQVLLLNKSTAPPPPPPPSTPPKMPPCLDVLKAWQGAWTTKPTRDATFANSYFMSNGTLESPTSTLKFSENIFNIPPPIGFVENYVEFNSGATQFGNHMNNFPEVKDRILENTMLVHDDVEAYPIDHTTYISDTLRLPSFMESFNDLLPENVDDNQVNTNDQLQRDDNVDGSCGGDSEDQNKNYWNNILNLVTLQSGSSVF